jgi:hypothetical protein
LPSKKRREAVFINKPASDPSEPPLHQIVAGALSFLLTRSGWAGVDEYWRANHENIIP